VQVDDLPAGRLFSKNDRATVQESGPIIEMERGNRYCSRHLKLEISRLNIHVRSSCATGTNIVEYFLEEALEFSAPLGAMRKLARIEDSRIVGEGAAKVKLI
jgi:hypothetical protein